MQPDRRDHLHRPWDPAGWFNGPADEPAVSDAELAALSAALEAAGRRARAARGSANAAPSAAWAAGLRRRLTDGLESSTPAVAPVTGALGAAPSPVAPAGEIPAPAPRPVSVSAYARAWGPHNERPVPLAPSVSRRTPTILPAPRFTLAAIAAALIVSVVALGTGLLHAVPATARVGDAVETALVRDGQRMDLAVGTALHVGDTVEVASTGHATLELDRVVVRLDGGARFQIDGLDDGVVVEQLAGRAWHRVTGADGPAYAVRTASVTWTATGTAFDIDRGVDAGGVPIVVERSIEHAVRIAGPDFAATVPEGAGATVRLGEGLAEVATRTLLRDELDDPWLIGNAAADVARGWPAGIMDGLLALASGAPTPAPATPAPEPTASPSLTTAPETPAVATPVPTVPPTATPKPTPKPTPRPTPKPTPKPTLATLGLSSLSCPGGTILDWTGYEGVGFAKYTVLRAIGAEVPVAWPPTAGVVALGGATTKDQAITDGQDADAAAGTTYGYRALAIDGSGGILAASPIAVATGTAIGSLESLTVSSPAAATVQLDWTPFGGSGDCFTYYKLVFSDTDPAPSYLKGSAYLAAIAEPGAATWSGDLAAGTYWFRVQAVRTTSLGKFIVAQTAVVQFAVP
jgi:hypothetical protein